MGDTDRHVNSYRIGVLADTHVPEMWPALPAAVAQALHGVHLILHLGDLTSPDVLRDLSSIAPVIAIRGDHDDASLPRQALVHVLGLRIGMVHGTPTLYRELAAAHTNSGDWASSLPRDATPAWREVDALLFGHTHRPLMARHNGVLFFSPGAVYQYTVETLRVELAKDPPLAKRLTLQRLLDHAEKSGADAVMPPTIGLLTIADGVIHAEVQPLASAANDAAAP